MAEIFEDFGVSTLASSVAIGAVSFTVQTGDGAKFPNPSGSDFFRVLLFNKISAEHEFVTVTSRTGDVMTCAATTKSYNAGDVAENRPSKDFFASLNVTDSAVQDGGFLYGDSDTGATDDYIFALTPTIISLKAGMELRLKCENENTGACTVTLDALASIDVKMETGIDPPSGVIRAGFTHTFRYDGTNFILQSVGLALSSSGFNALGKQIKNVAAGTDAKDAATIGGVESLDKKTLLAPVIAAMTGVSTINGNNFYRRYSGVVNCISGDSFNAGGAGLTVSNPNTGDYLITHNFNSSSYAVLATSNSTAYKCSHRTRNLNDVVISVTDASGAGQSITEFSFEIIRY